jgi:hypothetical protein
MRNISDRRKWDEIAERGASWGIFPTRDVVDHRGRKIAVGVMAAESFLVQKRIAPGMSAVVHETRVIGTIDPRSRIQTIIRLRRGRGERGIRKRMALAYDRRQRYKAHVNDDMKHEFGLDFRRLLRGASQVWMGG